MTLGLKLLAGVSGSNTDVPYSRFLPNTVVATGVKVCATGSYICESGLEPSSNTLPSGNRCSRGYSGAPEKIVPAAVHVEPLPICTVVLRVELVSSNPESTMTCPLPRTVAVGYQRPPLIPGPLVNFSVAGLNKDVFG